MFDFEFFSSIYLLKTEMISLLTFPPCCIFAENDYAIEIKQPLCNLRLKFCLRTGNLNLSKSLVAYKKSFAIVKKVVKSGPGLFTYGRELGRALVGFFEYVEYVGASHRNGK